MSRPFTGLRIAANAQKRIAPRSHQDSKSNQGSKTASCLRAFALTNHLTSAGAGLGMDVGLLAGSPFWAFSVVATGADVGILITMPSRLAMRCASDAPLFRPP